MSRDNLETTGDESASRLGTGIIYVEGRGKKKGGGGSRLFQIGLTGGLNVFIKKFRDVSSLIARYAETIYVKQ